DWSRTSTALRPPSPEPGASANSATRAIRGRRLGGASAGVNRLRVAYIAEMGRPRRPVKRRARAPRAAGLDAERVVGALAGGGGRGQTAARLWRRLGAGRHELRALRRILRQLQDAGRIERVDGVWRLPRADGLLDAELVETRRARDEHGREYRLEDAAGAKPGDRVLIAPLAGGRAELLQGVDGGRDHWVGILHGHGKLLGICPYRDEGDWGIPVSRGGARGAAAGEVGGGWVRWCVRFRSSADRGAVRSARARPGLAW